MLDQFAFMLIWKLFFMTFATVFMFSFLARKDNTLTKTFILVIGLILLGEVLKAMALDPFATFVAEIIGIWILVNWIYNLPINFYLFAIIYFKIINATLDIVLRIIFGYNLFI